MNPIKGRTLKICFISTHGGHFRELLNIAEGVAGEKYFVTHYSLQTAELMKDKAHYYITYPYKSILKYIWNGVQSIRHVLREKPQVIVSTGAGSAVPSILLCKVLLRSKIIYIESAARVATPSKTGKLLYKFADLFLIQWSALQSRYPKAIYCGLL